MRRRRARRPAECPPRSRRAFTLIEVLVAFAIVATGVIAMVGLQIDSLRTLDRLTNRIEADLWVEDAYARHMLGQMGYAVDPVHPKLQELHPDWNVEVDMLAFEIEELPFVPVLPVGWQMDWVTVKVVDENATTIAEMQPLWVHSENPDFTSESPTPIT